jgi:hypothetical protein
MASSGSGCVSGSDCCPTYYGGSGILADGDFSQAVNPGGNFIDYSKGSVLAPDWEVVKGEIDFNGTGFWDMDGLCSVDMDGYFPGGMRTSAFRTKRGTTYTVTFLLSGNGCEGSSEHCRPQKRMKLEAGNQFALFTWNTSNYNDVEHGVFAHESWKFIAAESLTVLSFISLDAKISGRGCVVAAVGVTKH